MKRLRREDCRCLDDILPMPDSDIDMLGYENGENIIPVPRSLRNLIKALKSWNYYLLHVYDLKKVDWNDSNIANQANFNKFWTVLGSLWEPPKQGPEKQRKGQHCAVDHAL